MPTPTHPQPDLKLELFHVWLAEPGTDPEDATYHRVLVTMEDQLVAEKWLADRGQSLTKLPLRLQSVMLRVAMERTGDWTGDAAMFPSHVVQYLPDKRVNPEAQTPEDETVIHPMEASTS